MDYLTLINEYIELEKKTLDLLDRNEINRALNLLHETFEKGGTVYTMGNGGSASTASHYVNDFNKGVSEHTEQKFRFVCLNDNVSTVLAVANDIGYEEIFRFQLQGKLQENDILIALSGSGNSKNVLNAVEYARSCGNKVIGLTGYDGGKLYQLSDIRLHVPVMSMQVTEDIHMVFDHLMMSVFYKTMCGIDHLRG